MNKFNILLALAIAGYGFQVDAKTVRHRAPLVAFAKAHPCPATGKPVPSCEGYVIDHVVPLCAGGPDEPSNMQWQTHADSLVKDRAERRQCAALRRAAKQ